MSLRQVLLGPDDAVLSDELNHASIIDGIRLCRAKRLRYKHMDIDDLENKLKESQVSVDKNKSRFTASLMLQEGNIFSFLCFMFRLLYIHIILNISSVGYKLISSYKFLYELNHLYTLFLPIFCYCNWYIIFLKMSQFLIYR